MQGCARARDVYSLKTVPAGAEDESVVEPQFCFADDFFAKRFVRKSVGAKIQPNEISSLGFDETNFRRAGTQKFAHEIDVPAQIREKRIDPRRAVFIRCTTGDEPDYVGLAVALAIELAQKFSAQRGIGDVSICDMQSGEIERLRRRGADGAFFSNSGFTDANTVWRAGA